MVRILDIILIHNIRLQYSLEYVLKLKLFYLFFKLKFFKIHFYTKYFIKI